MFISNPDDTAIGIDAILARNTIAKRERTGVSPRRASREQISMNAIQYENWKPRWYKIAILK